MEDKADLDYGKIQEKLNQLDLSGKIEEELRKYQDIFNEKFKFDLQSLNNESKNKFSDLIKGELPINEIFPSFSKLLEEIESKFTFESLANETLARLEAFKKVKTEGVMRIVYDNNDVFDGEATNETDPKTGTGYYKNKAETYLFFGEFENDKHKNGFLVIKKENNDFELHSGEFTYSEETKSYSLKGFIISKSQNDNSFGISLGTISNNFIDGVYIFKLSDKIQFLKGKINDGKKNDACVYAVGDFEDKKMKNINIFVGKYQDDTMDGDFKIFKEENYLINYKYDKGTPKEGDKSILKFKDSIFYGKPSYNTDEKKFTISDGFGYLISDQEHFYGGDIKSTKKHGRGKYFYEKTVLDGNFKDDQIIDGEVTIEDKLVFKGNFDEKSEIKQGIYNYQNGDVYEGSFVNSKRNGQGKYTYVDKKRYEGEWKDDMKFGKGTFFDIGDDKGTEYEWENDKQKA